MAYVKLRQNKQHSIYIFWTTEENMQNIFGFIVWKFTLDSFTFVEQEEKKITISLEIN